MNSKRVNTTATARLKQDYMRIMKDPVPYVRALPLPSNILEWHYIVRGPEKSPYEGKNKLCLSISDFHPDTWNPAWSVSTILTGLLSFMLEKDPTLGSIETSDYTKRQLAAQSGSFNLSDSVFCDLFPDVAEEIKEEQQRRAEELRQSTNHGAIGQRSHSNDGQNPADNENQGLIGSALANIFVIVGLAAFAYTVKYVLKSIVE
uniref:Ubiquitin-conjugating enzyme E2 J2 n=1 Tax=Magallana gigas TaxID=29159 RepID=K1RBY2_MAGGI